HFPHGRALRLAICCACCRKANDSRCRSHGRCPRLVQIAMNYARELAHSVWDKPRCGSSVGSVREENASDAKTCDRCREAALESLPTRFRGGLMRAAKRKKLEGSGWRVADAREFLNLSHAEVQFVEVKLALARL